MANDRNRMIVEILPEVQLAIKLRGVQNGVTTGYVVTEAMQRAFGEYIEEAKASLAKRQQKPQKKGKKPCAET